MTLTERASALYVFMVALNRHDEHTDALVGFGARDDLNAALSHAEALRTALQPSSLERSEAGAQPEAGEPKK
jgi:ribosomal protein S12 methylthiotransferase accessory factor YcaO